MEKQTYFYGTGRRKTAIARVRLMPGNGAVIINGIPYEAFADENVYSVKVEDRTIIMPPVEMPLYSGGRLVVSRKIYVPWEAKRNYVRYYDLIYNPTDIPQLAVVQFWGDLSEGKLTEVVEMRNGYAVIKQPQDDSAPQVGWVFKRGVGQNWDFSFRIGQGSVAYFVLIQPQSSVAFVNFVAQVPYPAVGTEPPPIGTLTDQTTIADVNGGDLGEQMDELAEHPDYEGMTEDEILLIWNMYIDSDINMDGYVNVIDLICVRNDLNKDPESAVFPRSDVNSDDQIKSVDMIYGRNDLGWPF